MISNASTGIATHASANGGVHVRVVRDDLSGDMEPGADSDQGAEQRDVPVAPHESRGLGWRASIGPEGIAK